MDIFVLSSSMCCRYSLNPSSTNLLVTVSLGFQYCNFNLITNTFHQIHFHSTYQLSIAAICPIALNLILVVEGCVCMLILAISVDYEFDILVLLLAVPGHKTACVLALTKINRIIPVVPVRARCCVCSAIQMDIVKTYTLGENIIEGILACYQGTTIDW